LGWNAGDDPNVTAASSAIGLICSSAPAATAIGPMSATVPLLDISSEMATETRKKATRMANGPAIDVNAESPTAITAVNPVFSIARPRPNDPANSDTRLRSIA
jgi:hypothetical protein